MMGLRVILQDKYHDAVHCQTDHSIWDSHGWRFLMYSFQVNDIESVMDGVGLPKFWCHVLL